MWGTSVLLVVLLLHTGSAVASADGERPKIKDAKGNKLIELSEIAVGCDEGGYLDLGIVNDSLEKCSEWKAAQEGSDAQKREYEERKCRQLRVNGQMNGAVCGCADKWKGPTCSYFHGCPEGYSVLNGTCSPTWCEHGGKLATSGISTECICTAPWDGARCNRLACWRKQSKALEKRWRNQGTECVCGEGYSGDDCSTIESCSGNATLANGRCSCPAGKQGERCDVSCKPNQPCSTGSHVLSVLALVFGLLLATRRQL